MGLDMPDPELLEARIAEAVRRSEEDAHPIGESFAHAVARHMHDIITAPEQAK